MTITLTAERDKLIKYASDLEVELAVYRSDLAEIVEVKRVTAERDAAVVERDLYKVLCRTAADQRDAARKERDAAQARIAELEAEAGRLRQAGKAAIAAEDAFRAAWDICPYDTEGQYNKERSVAFRAASHQADEAVAVLRTALEGKQP